MSVKLTNAQKHELLMEYQGKRTEDFGTYLKEKDE